MDRFERLNPKNKYVYDVTQPLMLHFFEPMKFGTLKMRTNQTTKNAQF